MKQKVQEAIVATPYASALMFDKIPPFAKKILQLDGGFEMYDVVYDDEEQCQYLQRRANALKVVVNGNKGINVDDEYESCSGKIGACIKYLRDYLDADDGYIGGGTLYLNDPNAVTDEEFTDFCQWMNQWLSSWINGVNQNRPLGKKLKIVDVKENDMLKGKPHNNHIDEGWGPTPTKTTKNYTEDGFDFIVTEITGKRRPRRNEGSKWIPYTMRKIALANDPTGKFSGRLYNDFGNVVLEPDFGGWDETYWAKQARIPVEKLSDLYDAAKKVLKQSNKDF